MCLHNVHDRKKENKGGISSQVMCLNMTGCMFDGETGCATWLLQAFLICKAQVLWLLPRSWGAWKNLSSDICLSQAQRSRQSRAAGSDSSPAPEIAFMIICKKNSNINTVWFVKGPECSSLWKVCWWLLAVLQSQHHTPARSNRSVPCHHCFCCLRSPFMFRRQIKPEVVVNFEAIKC